MNTIDFTHAVTEAARLSLITHDLRRKSSKLRRLKKQVAQYMREHDIKYASFSKTMWQIHGKWEQGCRCVMCKKWIQ